MGKIFFSVGQILIIDVSESPDNVLQDGISVRPYSSHSSGSDKDPSV